MTSTDPTGDCHQVTGLLKDIATANGPSSRWGIDTNPGTDGFRVVKWAGSQWAATNGRGVRIALRGTGDADHDGTSDVFVPWVVTSSGHIKRATDTSGSTWVSVPDLPNGVLARDIGGGNGGDVNVFPGGNPPGNEDMWAVGQDGRLYVAAGDPNFPQWVIPSGAPNFVIAVSSGPHRSDFFGEILALTSAGEVWLANSQHNFVKLGAQADTLRTDVAAGSSMLAR